MRALFLLASVCWLACPLAACLPCTMASMLVVLGFELVGVAGYIIAAITGSLASPWLLA